SRPSRTRPRRTSPDPSPRRRRPRPIIPRVASRRCKGPVMGPPPAVVPARPQELEAAFRLIFRYLAAEERATRVAHALRLVRQGERDPAGVLVGAAPGGPAGAIVCLPVPGASGLIWPPQAVEGPGRVAVEDALVRRASAWLRECGARLGQCLLAADELPL